MEYTKQFKAKIALEAANEANVSSLSKKHSIPEAKIKLWMKQLKERAATVFAEESSTVQDEAIHDHATLLRRILEASPSGIMVTDLNKNLIDYNQKCVEMWRVPKEIEEEGKMEHIMLHAEKLVKETEEFLSNTDEAYFYPEQTFEDIIAFKDGRFLQRYSVPYRVNGQILGRVINFVDITEHKNAEKKLSDFSNLLQSINANVNEGILRSTPDQGLVYVNDAFVEIFGYSSKEDVLATDPAEFYAEKSNRRGLVKRLQGKGGITNEEILFRRKNGSTFWGLENSTMVRHNGKTFIDGVITDIHEKKKAEQALRKSEEKYRAILKNIEEGYFELNLAGDLTFFNTKLVEMMSYPAEDMVGMNNREYMDEANAEKVYEIFNRVYQTGVSENRFDWELICGDGSKIYVEASVTLRKDSDGNAIGFSGMIRNVTERKRKEQQIKKSLKEKEVLLGEIHHRVKNNLAIISGLLYLQADKTDDPKAFQALMESQSRINSMALIHELLYDNHTFASLDPRTYIKELVEHIASNLTIDKRIETCIEAESFDLEMSTAIPCALIINELLTNAFKYAFEKDDRGMIKIIFHKKKTKRKGYHLEVADNGHGLPANFDITDSSHHSLGLSLVKTLCRQLNGNLEIENSIHGARFMVTFTD